MEYLWKTTFLLSCLKREIVQEELNKTAHAPLMHTPSGGQQGTSQNMFPFYGNTMMTPKPHLIPLLYIFGNQNSPPLPYSLYKAITSSIHASIEDELQRVLLYLKNIGLVQLQKISSFIYLLISFLLFGYMSWFFFFFEFKYISLEIMVFLPYHNYMSNLWHYFILMLWDSEFPYHWIFPQSTTKRSPTLLVFCIHMMYYYLGQHRST